MREIFDGIRKYPHPAEAVQRLSRRTHHADPVGRQFLGCLCLRGSLVTIPDPASRPLIAAAACLLDQGRVVDGLSRLLTAAALLVLLLPAVLPAGPQRLPAVILAAVALLGMVETFFAVRVGFDAALFHRLSAGPDALDFTNLDNALMRLGLASEPRPGRSTTDRVAGASRLLYRQATMLALQICLIAAAAVLAAWR
jgi:hypothetical protein